MFRFDSPYLLLILSLLPLVAWYRRRGHRQPALAGSDRWPDTEQAPPFAVRIGRILPALYYTALILMIAALARPQWGTRQITLDTMGINIILALDLSESMAAMDFKQGAKHVSRLEAVKSVVLDFISGRNADRIGVVAFGSQAYTQLPLTRDDNTIKAVVQRLQIGAAGRRTAVGDAIGIGLKRLQDIPSRSKIIILLTDGQSNSGELSPDVAAEIARENHVKVHTIGVGGRGRAPFLIDDPVFGRRTVYQQVDLDEETLRMIADKTGGLYFSAQDLEGLRKIYQAIDEMEKSPAPVKSFAEYNELYMYLLWPAFGLLSLWIVLTHTRFLAIP
jgi:Ca-activated chloride channel family protein